MKIEKAISEHKAAIKNLEELFGMSIDGEIEFREDEIWSG
ncbi:unnamed protein product, partial [marine sediment metagenome]